MRRTAMMGAAVLTFSLSLTGCGDDTSSTTSPGSDASRSTPAQGAGQVPDAGELAGMLATAEALGDGWTEQRPPDDVGVETPGVVPEAQQQNLPRIQFCDAASDESKQAAEGLRFQAARIFALDVEESPRNHQVFVQEFLMADDEDMIDETYAALADGIAACEGEKTDYGDGVIGRSSLMPSTTLGTESVGIHDVVKEPSPRGPATWDLRNVIAHDGPVLVSLQLGDVRVGENVQPRIDDESTTAIVAAVADAMR